MMHEHSVIVNRPQCIYDTIRTKSYTNTVNEQGNDTSLKLHSEKS